MTHTLTGDEEPVAVATDVFYEPMSTCPIATKVLLLGQGGVATISNYVRGDGFWHGWAPLPRKRKAKQAQGE